MSKKKIIILNHEEENGEAWLLPYSDLMTLLLAVFIVLFAVSQVDIEKAKLMSDEFSESMMTKSYNLAKEEMREGQSTDSDNENFLGDDEERMKLEELKKELDEKLVSENMHNQVSTAIDKRGLVVSLNNAVFFDSGSAEIKSDYKNSLLEIGKIICTMDNFIRIEGHTDNVPMSSEIFPSNWDLSAARAANVVRLFLQGAGGAPEKMIAVGYGEYRPVADNNTDAGRTKNRRIDIIVMSDKYSEMEKS
ncbi:MAG: OmpA family protein [Anaerovoracaceae bacterium]|jgi:chemotaxis protein MotB